VVREHGDVDIEQGLRFAVKRIQLLDFNSDAHISLKKLPELCPG
jgi:hypothetical protein